MAERSGRMPATLYKMCMSRLAVGARAHETADLHTLPDTVLMDTYYQMLLEKKLCVLGSELAELDVFSRLLRFAGTQDRLLTCFQAVIEHGSNVTAELADSYQRRCARLLKSDPTATTATTTTTTTTGAEADVDSTPRDDIISLGLKIGGFLNEAGWYADAERVLSACCDVCRAAPPAPRYTTLTLECCHRLLNTQSAYCSFPGAADTCALALSLLDMREEVPETGVGRPAARARDSTECESAATKLSNEVMAECQLDDKDWSARDAARAVGKEDLLPRLYKEFSSLFFVCCDYNAAYKWSTRALQLLRPETPARVAVEVVRACGKACVVKRRFARAGLLMRQAVAMARRAFGPQHPRYAFALLDYGFYLLNIDSILHSVSVYEEALGVLRGVFGARSLHVATAQEDLAYALYVLEYSSGRFYKAKEHAEKAISIIEGLVPSDHLLLASAKRVKALILEEIALDTPAGHDIHEPSLLEESEALHKAALALSMMAFGEKNVQTAKHYGNLGRLYQSMQKFQDAEMMHLKAIAIKEELLGAEDYEVGLSIGHLASLYNYHMHMYCAAEELYFRSISISLKLFGECYSGLEYDYRGLVHVFTQLKKHDQAQLYNQLLHHWHELREQSKAEQQLTIGEERAVPLDELKKQFFNPNID